ncbi:MAG: patatin-like phospholipase family protein [Alphaproteobacteria bacterium]|nr:patatin-like phospholipase family protein [Alphaproteobacteria bacterium]
MTVRKITLALQGGGAHGAFTWGVLDRLLDDDSLDIQGISGTSAGAMNAGVLASGLARGRGGAKEALAGFWRAISDKGAVAFNPYQSTPFHDFNKAWNVDWSPASIWLDVMAQFVSPYQLNPLDRNPLRDLLSEHLKFEQLRQEDAIKLFICATNVLTNRLKIFDNADLSVDAFLASACLPQMHRAVEIDGDFYWDGGFTGNPVLKPLISTCEADDIVIVQLNPTMRSELPITSRDIMDRLNEVTMNASLMRELDHVATLTRLVESGSLKSKKIRPVRLHCIADPEVMSPLGMRSKNNTAWNFLSYLKDAGRNCADAWLKQNRRHIGKTSTLDLGDFSV